MIEFLADFWAVAYALRWLIVLAAFAILVLLYAEVVADNNHLRRTRARLESDNAAMRRRLHPLNTRELLRDIRARNSGRQ